MEADCFSPLVEWKNEEVVGFTTAVNFRECATITQCSRSSPVTRENCGKLVLNKSKLKKSCRNGVHPNARKRMWLDVVEVTDADSVLLVKAFGEPQEGMIYGLTARAYRPQSGGRACNSAYACRDGEVLVVVTKIEPQTPSKMGAKTLYNSSKNSRVPTA